MHKIRPLLLFFFSDHFSKFLGEKCSTIFCSSKKKKMRLRREILFHKTLPPPKKTMNATVKNYFVVSPFWVSSISSKKSQCSKTYKISFRHEETAKIHWWWIDFGKLKAILFGNIDPDHAGIEFQPNQNMQICQLKLI